MKRSIYCNLFLLVIPVIAACTEDKVTGPAESELIMGKWEWIKTEQFFPSYKTETPQSAGYSHQLEFVDEDDIIYYLADTVFNICKYRIENNTITICSGLWYYKLNASVLLLSQTYVDGPAMTYVKLPKCFIGN